MHTCKRPDIRSCTNIQKQKRKSSKKGSSYVYYLKKDEKKWGEKGYTHIRSLRWKKRFGSIQMKIRIIEIRMIIKTLIIIVIGSASHWTQPQVASCGRPHNIPVTEPWLSSAKILHPWIRSESLFMYIRSKHKKLVLKKKWTRLSE